MSRSMLLFVCALWVGACGGSDKDSDSNTGGTGTGTATGTATGTGTGTGSGCNTWAVTYDLAGSTFFIDAVLDFTITVQAPYDEDRNMGPGQLTVEFQDVGGAPAHGAVAITDYQLTQNFVTGIALAEVTTLLENTAADSCGAATGTLAGDTATWNPSQLDPYCQTGEVSCVGSFCGTSGSPPEGQPFTYDNVCGTQALEAFVFSPDHSSFSAAGVVVAQDANQTSTMTLVGTETSRELRQGQPDCLCP